MYAHCVYPSVMDACHDPVAALGALERRFDGPIPEPLRLAAQLGSPARVEELATQAQAAFFRERARRQIELIRRRRGDGTLLPDMLADLRLYRARWRHWDARARAQRAAASGAGSPRASPQLAV